MEPMGFELAWLTHKRYRCSQCWGELGTPQTAENGLFLVLCLRCGSETKGYVSQHYVERRRSDSIGEARDVRKLLISLGEIQNPLAGKSKNDLIKELGF